jgi:hypothetical protein
MLLYLALDEQSNNCLDLCVARLLILQAFHSACIQRQQSAQRPSRRHRAHARWAACGIHLPQEQLREQQECSAASASSVTT